MHRCPAFDTRMNARLVEVDFELVEFPLKIMSIPEKDVVQILAPDRSNEPVLSNKYSDAVVFENWAGVRPCHFNVRAGSRPE